MKLLFEKRFFLAGLTPGSAEEALSPGNMQRQVALGRASLLSFAAPVFKQRVARDPIGLFSVVESNLKLAAGSMALAGEGDCVFSRDGRHCLVSFHPAAAPSDFTGSDAMIANLKRIIGQVASRPGLTQVRTMLMGPHLFASEGSRTVKRDVAVAFSVSSVCILLLFFLFFRGIRPLLLASVVLGLSIAAGVAAAGLVTGRLHGITLGFASILLGISIDYVIHVLAACRFEGGGGRAASAAAARVFPSLLAGWLTTMAIFLLLAANKFPLVKQMGVVAAAGVTAAFLVSFLFLPFVAAGPGGKKSESKAALAGFIGMLTRQRGAAIAAAAAAGLIIALGAFFGLRLQVESDVEKLDYRSPETRKSFDEFQDRWTVLGRGDAIIARGETLQEALRRNDEVYAKLRQGLDKGTIESFMSISPLMPSLETQGKSLSAFTSRENSIRAVLKAASESYGFEEDFFQPFFNDLERSAKGEEPALGPDAVEGTFLKKVLLNASAEGENRAYVISTFIPSGDRKGFLAALPSGEKNISWLNRRVFLGKIFETLIRETAGTLIISFFAVLLLLLVYFRSVKLTVIALIPLLFAIPVEAGLFAAPGWPVNAIGLLSFCLVVGLGIDYGIFMVNALRGKTDAGRVTSAVLLSAGTTTIAFGALMFCRSPVLSAVGKVVFVGIVLNALAAVILMPLMWGILHKRSAGLEPRPKRP
ncbi:MAG: MMPL family transporter [Pseudomonadota bacterium]